MQYTERTIKDSVATISEADAKTVCVKNAKKISIIIRRSEHNSGSSVAKVYIAMSDGETASPYVQYKKLIVNQINSNSQTKERVDSVTLAANGTALYTVDPDDCFDFIKVAMTRVTDGKNNVWVCVDYGDQQEK